MDYVHNVLRSYMASLAIYDAKYIEEELIEVNVVAVL